MVSKSLKERITNGEDPTLESLQCATEEYLPDELIKEINKLLWNAASEGKLYIVFDIREKAYYFQDKSDATNPLKIPDTVELIKLYYQRRGLRTFSFDEKGFLTSDSSEGEESDETVYLRNISTIVITWRWEDYQEPVYK
jgi:hypothetical protein